MGTEKREELRSRGQVTQRLVGLPGHQKQDFNVEGWDHSCTSQSSLWLLSGEGTGGVQWKQKTIAVQQERWGGWWLDLSGGEKWVGSR